jgi:hypothetical protein
MICPACRRDEHWRCTDTEWDGVCVPCDCLHSEDTARLYSHAAALWGAISAGDLAAVAKECALISGIVKPRPLRLVTTVDIDSLLKAEEIEP